MTRLSAHSPSTTLVMVRSTVLRTAAWPLVALWLGACGGGVGQAPKPAAADSVVAQTELRELETDWEIGSPLQKQELRPRLEEFVEEHGDDPSADRARVMLGDIALAEGRLGAAEEAIRPVLDGEESRQRDEAALIMAGVKNRQGEPEEALAILEPLSGKLLTEDSRHTYSRERVAAALAARRWRLALDATTTWIAEADERQAEARDWVRQAVREVPTHALSRLLTDWDETQETPENREARTWLQHVVIDHLTQEALKTQNARLARDLLDSSPTWLRASEAGDELALLAALARDEARVSGRTIGIVVGGADPATRRRSVRAALGLMQGLDLGLGKASDEEGVVRLLVEDARDDVATALASLSGQGAAVLVAAVDEDTARDAVAFAEARRVPVVVLSQPRGVDVLRLRYGFVFGVSVGQQSAVLRSGLTTAGASNVALVGGEALPCPRRAARPGLAVLPLSDWHAAGVDAVGVLGDDHCARLVRRQLELSQDSIRLAVGLNAASTSLAPTSAGPVLRLAAGGYPERVEPPPRDRYSKSETEPREPVVGWFEQLGLDLAALLGRAVRALPETVAIDADDVRRSHDLARDALLKAESDLSTTQGRGFSGQQVISRELRLIESSSGNTEEGQ